MKKGYIRIIDKHFTGPKEIETGQIDTECLIGVENGAIVIKYKEALDAPDDCETRLIVNDSRVTMMRTGSHRTTMVFENKKRHLICYGTPFGDMMMGVYTNAIFIDMDEDGGILDFAFTLDSSGDLLSENEMKIFVETKEEDYVNFG